jgi:hypothetical protein
MNIVMGIDHDHELVEIAKSLRAGDRSDSVQYSLREEGQLDRVRVVDLQEHKVGCRIYWRPDHFAISSYLSSDVLVAVV